MAKEKRQRQDMRVKVKRKTFNEILEILGIEGRDTKDLVAKIEIQMVPNAPESIRLLKAPHNRSILDNLQLELGKVITR